MSTRTYLICVALLLAVYIAINIYLIHLCAAYECQQCESGREVVTCCKCSEADE